MHGFEMRYIIGNVLKCVSLIVCLFFVCMAILEYDKDARTLPLAVYSIGALMTFIYSVKE